MDIRAKLPPTSKAALGVVETMGAALPKTNLILSTRNAVESGLLIDKVGANTRTLKDLQYIQSAGGLELTHASITAGGTTIVNVPAGPTATIAAPQAGKIVVGAGTLWSWIITFPDMTVSSYEFATALTATTGVCFDTSGYGRHLLFTVADTSVVCVSGREFGSDWLNLNGWAVADGTQYLDDAGEELIPDDVLIPALSGGSGGCSYSWEWASAYLDSQRLYLDGNAVYIGV
jgi:hypothetical protein